jgi:hypothetical protein
MARPESVGQIGYEQLLVHIAHARAPSNHLVDLASPTGAPEALLLDDVGLMANEAPALEYIGPWLVGGSLRGIWETETEVRLQIVENKLKFYVGHESAPPDHFVSLSLPSGPRQPLLAN